MMQEKVFHDAEQKRSTTTFDEYNTVNDRLSAAALIKVFRFLGAALIRLRRLFDCGAYFKD